MHRRGAKPLAHASARVIVMFLALAGLQYAPPPALAASDVAHYKVSTRFDPSSGYLRSSVDIVLPASELRHEPVFVLSGQLKLEPIDAGSGASVSVEPTDKPIRGLQMIALRFDRPPTQPVTIRFKYAGPINSTDDEPAFSSERVELNMEHFWLPIRRDLGLFFTAEADIRGLPEGVVAVAQGEFRQQGSRVIIKRAVADNDLTVTAAPGLTKRASGDVEFYASDHDDPLVALLHEHAVGAATFHRRLFGPAAAPIRMVVVPRASGGGYARLNFIVMPTFRKPGEPTPAFDKSSPARFVAHEFNHAWLRSPAGGGSNHWVAESVAEYMALRYIEATFGEQELATMLTRKRRPAMDAGSLLTDDRPPGAALYQKGPILLRHLEKRIGRTALDKILIRADRPRSTEEFLAALIAVAGEPIAKEFEQALKQEGLSADAASIAAPDQASVRTSYSVVMSGTIKGELTVVDHGKGERQSTLRFDDRGRGPDLRTTSRYDERGLPQSHVVDGLSYAKRAVLERFATSNARATWSSDADSGEAAAGGFYLPNESNAEDMAALVRALLKAEGGQLTLLPGGQARLEKKLEHPVLAGPVRVSPTLYLVSGIDLQPAAIWLDADRELFASAGSWISFIRKGFEAVAPELVKAQDQVLAAEAAARTRAMRRKPNVPVVIRNATLFEPEHRAMRPGMSVLVRDERIAAVGPTSTLTVPKHAEVIEANGKVLLPGLWDMHVHVLAENDGVLDLMAGVTSVRDLGNDVATLQRLTQQFDDATLAGPSVMKAGMIDGRGPYAAPTGTLVETAAQVCDAVNAFADRGYVQIKLYSSLPRELVEVGVNAAHARGMRVGGHVPAGMTMRDAVLAGFDEVQHANFWFLNFMPADVVGATNTPIRFSATYQHARELDLAAPAVRDFIAVLKDRGTVVDPTLVVFENMFTGKKGELARWIVPWEARLPAVAVRSGRGGGRGSTPQERAAFTESFTRMKQMLKALHVAGVPIVAGTDGSALQYARELELYVEAGIPAAEVLYIATLGAARVMKKDAEAGSIAVGKRADLVLVHGDPLNRISDVRRTDLIMKAGAIYTARDLSIAAGLVPESQTNERQPHAKTDH